MQQVNGYPPYFYPVQQPMYYQQHQGVNGEFLQQPIQNGVRVMEQPFQISPTEQPLFYPPNRQFHQQLGGMGPKMPYPKQSQGQVRKPATNIFAQFKTADGNYDINKMINTAGTMVNTMNQITGMFKQVGGFFTKQ